MARRISEYGRKLLDPRWQRLRLKVLESDGWVCVDCGNGSRTLHVHHLLYLRDHEPWEYEPEDLVTLCDKCHEQREEAMLRLRRALRGQDSLDIHSIATLCEFGVSASDCLHEMNAEMLNDIENARGR